jgi:hypothetical protein
MPVRNARSIPVSWILAVVLPVALAPAAWGLASATTSARYCATGEGGSSLVLLGLVGLVLLPPIAIGGQSRRIAGSASRALSPIVISILLGVVAVFFGSQAWWGSHNCMT